MLISATLKQTRFLLRRRGAVATFLLLLALVLLNFTNNVLDFRGSDLLSMYHPMKLLSLSYNRTNWNADSALRLIQLFPLLVSLPAGLSLAAEQQSGEEVLLASRLGRRAYLFSRYLAAFLVTALVFALPFLIEIALNCISFPLQAEGDFMNYSIYNVELHISEAAYQLPWLYQLSPYLYAVVFTLYFGAAAGVFGGLTLALSALWRVRFRVLLLLPVFIGLQAASLLNMCWYNSLLLFCDRPRSDLVFGLLLLLILGLSLLEVGHASRKDCLR